MSGFDPALDVQEAMLAALRSDPTLTGLVGARIHDATPPGEVEPFVELGLSLSEPALETNDSQGSELVQTLHVWSKKPGRVECSEVCAAIKAVLHERELIISDGTVVLQRLTSQRIMQDPNGISMHGIQRFTFWICP